MNALRKFAAGAGLVLMSLTGGCGKPAVAKREFKNNSVDAEQGELPAAGKASRLLTEQSAFLRRHANDPVDWHPWGAEVFEKARRDNKPLLVSIGYASCPWSQKMHTESFLKPEIARFMNKHFICVLVDREERPDVNTAFLHYSFWKQKISGWPLHIWLTPNGLPIYQGIYFPPDSVGNNPSWRLTIEHVANNWQTSPDYVGAKAKESAESYLADFRRRWLGPPAEGNMESEEAKKFLKLTDEEQLSRFRDFAGDRLGYALADLPSAKLEELWTKMTPEQTGAMMDRLSVTGASLVFAKLQGPAREPAFQLFSRLAREAHYQKLRGVYDPGYGGFGPPPRFAPHQAIDFLLRFGLGEKGRQFGKQEEALEMITTTLDHMLAGGILDQIGGGFHRYSTDVYWAVPQFEKMLYDQGYMSQALVAAAQVSGKKDYLTFAARLLAYAERELSHPEGGFYCAEGSSSPGPDGAMTEGAYYVWSKQEVDAVAGDASPLVCAVFGIEDRGNLPLDSTMRTRLGNTNVLTVKQTPEEAGKSLGIEPAAAREQFNAATARLLEARRKRPRPMLEDKVLTSWNGVIVSGFARTGWALKDPALIKRGERAVEFLLTKLRSKDGGLLHAFLDGPSPLPGYSEDYATLIAGLIDLYEATGNARWLSSAMELQERQIKDLWDKTDGGFFDGPDSPFLFHRMKSMDEASEISAGSTSLINLANLSIMTGNTDYRDKARRIMERYGVQAAIMPGAFVRFLRAVDLLAASPQQIVISAVAGDAAVQPMLDALRGAFLPGIRVLYMDGAESEKLLTAKVPDLAPLAAQPGKSVVHFCTGFKPDKSFTTEAELRAWLAEKYSLASPAAP